MPLGTQVHCQIGNKSVSDPTDPDPGEESKQSINMIVLQCWLISKYITKPEA